MAFNLVIGLGNTGTQIVKAATKSAKLTDVKFYTIDSVTSSIDMAHVTNITSIPIISDDKNGSGRSRERGAAMYMYHDEAGAFNQLYEDAKAAKSPVVVITSAAGGTGSGSIIPLCRKLMSFGTEDAEFRVVPIIIFPAMEDPDVFHFNTNDLMLELDEVGITTYSIFRNTYGNADYSKINQEVVSSLELIFGKWYHETTADSIDDSDLDMILKMPGRFVSVTATASQPNQLKRAITESMFNGSQPLWDGTRNTLMTAFGVKSPFASDDFKDVFDEIRSRIGHTIDEYRNIVNEDGVCEASVIVAGLSQVKLKQIDSDFQGASSIASGAKKSTRPSFMSNKSHINQAKTGSNSELKKFRNLSGLNLVSDK